ncbi:hypothetical protein PR202_ga30094 [Eleusine coracana subsp. coracana]|uniref:Uncharacterized protein n=1 Tax=Eleusine coracana subsp. coracana TaxID=191504 RepID=A0AAV5DP10_ELECO|nr:hypothetical protein PR202_ga30094 [Eleusine coracana subsp. coracana]
MLLHARAGGPVRQPRPGGGPRSDGATRRRDAVGAAGNRSTVGRSRQRGRRVVDQLAWRRHNNDDGMGGGGGGCGRCDEAAWRRRPPVVVGSGRGRLAGGDGAGDSIRAAWAGAPMVRGWQPSVSEEEGGRGCGGLLRSGRSAVMTPRYAPSLAVALPQPGPPSPLILASSRSRAVARSCDFVAGGAVGQGRREPSELPRAAGAKVGTGRLDPTPSAVDPAQSLTSDLIRHRRPFRPPRRGDLAASAPLLQPMNRGACKGGGIGRGGRGPPEPLRTASAELKLKRTPWPFTQALWGPKSIGVWSICPDLAPVSVRRRWGPGGGGGRRAMGMRTSGAAAGGTAERRSCRRRGAWLALA